MRNGAERAQGKSYCHSLSPGMSVWWAGGISWRGVSLLTSSHCLGCWFGGTPTCHRPAPMGCKAGAYLQKRTNAWKQFVEMAKGLLLSAKVCCHSCYCQMEGKDAACGLQILSSPKDWNIKLNRSLCCVSVLGPALNNRHRHTSIRAIFLC